MKAVVIVLAVCLAGVFAEDPIKDINKEYIKGCLIENGFDPREYIRDNQSLRIASNRSLTEPFRFPAEQYPTGLRNAKVPEKQEQNRNCYYSCMMKKMNLMKADGSLNEDALRQKFNMNLDTLGKALSTCKEQVKDDKCKLAACLMANRGA
ncbi:hypothetical protein TSAR_005941 [Trichomalopsis sarcophagae]|uniref:Uncharacterized protein n=1 Tax=Trichomalopsis sarcophagae TaxID=543379 RepID=A0A232EZ25_9HYME|nr:hypothetical protein TSAR_005941 [Trichomalopsis sarcophagae]